MPFYLLVATLSDGMAAIIVYMYLENCPETSIGDGIFGALRNKYVNNRLELRCNFNQNLSRAVYFL